MSIMSIILVIYNAPSYYGDILYDQPNNQAFSKKPEVVQYNAAFPITGAIRVTSKTNVYQELGLESLAFLKILQHIIVELIPLNIHFSMDYC